MPKLWYVATYGNHGLEVEFFDDSLAYDRAVHVAKVNHFIGRLDTYTHGDASVWPPTKIPPEPLS